MLNCIVDFALRLRKMSQAEFEVDLGDLAVGDAGEAVGPEGNTIAPTGGLKRRQARQGGED